MRAATFHDALRHMPIISPEQFLADGPVVILAPHPDDETLGTGGLIAAAAAAGTPPTVIILTDGAGSHPRSKLYDRDRLIALRKAESAEAAARLGLSSTCLHHLDAPDTALPTSGAAFNELRARVAEITRAARARTVLVTWDQDPHCDHEAAAELARALRHNDPELELWFYPVWGWHIPAEDEIPGPLPAGVRIDIARYQETKRAALAAHASQMTDLIPDDPDGFRFKADELAPFQDRYEYVFRIP